MGNAIESVFCFEPFDWDPNLIEIFSEDEDFHLSRAFQCDIRIILSILNGGEGEAIELFQLLCLGVDHFIDDGSSFHGVVAHDLLLVQTIQFSNLYGLLFSRDGYQGIPSQETIPIRISRNEVALLDVQLLESTIVKILLELSLFGLEDYILPRNQRVLIHFFYDLPESGRTFHLHAQLYGL